MTQDAIAAVATAPSGETYLSTVRVIVPTLNAGAQWRDFADGLRRQGIAPQQVLIVDSSSGDNTQDLARAAGFDLAVIPRDHFNHGGTRQYAAELSPHAEVLVYLTQDAVFAGNDDLSNIARIFADPGIGAAFGRQLPRAAAGLVESFSRQYNYQPLSCTRSLEDRRKLGFRVLFSSDSFAAYRRSALASIGGFERDTIVSEEVIVCAKLLKAGWKTAYVAEAAVRHSHEYSILDDLHHYFDIGVAHARHAWILRDFGEPGGEGRKFVSSLVRGAWPQQRSLIPAILLRSAARYLGYRLGRIEAALPRSLKRELSQQRWYWR